MGGLIESYRGKLYFFYANECDEDIAQYNHIKHLDNIRFFSINGKEHGVPLFGISITEIIKMPFDSLDKLCERFKNKKISPERILFATNHFTESVLYIVGRFIKKNLNKLFKTESR